MEEGYTEEIENNRDYNSLIFSIYTIAKNRLDLKFNECEEMDFCDLMDIINFTLENIEESEVE